MRSMSICEVEVNDHTDAYVIAEIGHNHEGNLAKAEELVRKAAEAGAHAAKLQKRENRSLYTRAMFDEPYTSKNSFGPTYGTHREALEFGAKEYRHLAEVARAMGIHFLSTAFDKPSVDFLVGLDVPAIKLASGDITNTPLLEYAAKTGRALIISTGAAEMDDVRRAMDTVLPINDNVALLQCTAVYPATAASLNLRVIETYRREFPDVVIGYSGHDPGTDLSMVAYSLGARVVEKHFTLDRTRPGSDHHFSLEPEMMGTMVSQLRAARQSLGSAEKFMLAGEAGARRKMGKKLVAARRLAVGHTLSRNDIAVKSPGDGLPPYQLDDLIGRSLAVPLEEDANLDHTVLV